MFAGNIYKPLHMSKENICCLIIGLGSTGRRHLKNLAKLGYSNFIAVSQGRCPLPKDKLPSLTIVPNLEAALAASPKVAFICTPTALHMEAALAAAKAGCHLFLEKPLSHSWKGVAELQKRVDEKGLKVQLGFQFRYHPVLKKIKALLEKEAIGRLIAVQAHWGEYLRDWHPWEDYRESYSARKSMGGGVILTLCHPFDYLRWLVGEVQTVFALAGQSRHLDIDAEDYAQVSLRFENGTLGNVYLDYLQRPAQHTLTFIGEEGRIDWDYHRGTASVYYRDLDQMERLSPPFDFSRNSMFLEEVADFMSAIENDKEPQCNLKEGIASLQLTLAAKISAGSGLQLNIKTGQFVG